MARPIESTPVLRGQDAKNIVKDLQRKDVNKAFRQSAMHAIKTITRKSDK